MIITFIGKTEVHLRSNVNWRERARDVTLMDSHVGRISRLVKVCSLKNVCIVLARNFQHNTIDFESFDNDV